MFVTSQIVAFAFLSSGLCGFIEIINELLPNYREDCDNIVKQGCKPKCCIEKPKLCLETCWGYDEVAKRLVKPYPREIICCCTWDCESAKDCKYVEITLDVIRKHLKERFCEETCKRAKFILCCIRKQFKGCSPKELAYFTALALHNTSFFTIFVESENRCVDNYRGRGLLSIQTHDNYRKLDLCRSSRNDVSYSLTPEYLANVCETTICDTIKFWKKYIYQSRCTFEEVLTNLNLKNWKISCNNPEAKWTIDIKNLNCLCNDLLKLYKKIKL